MSKATHPHPTGNVLNDPDTWALPKGQQVPLNPQNATAQDGKALNLLGKSFADDKAAPVAVAPAPVVDDEVSVKQRIAALGTAMRAEGDEQQATMARESLAQIAVEEYARPDGGRINVKRALASRGFGKPAA